MSLYMIDNIGYEKPLNKRESYLKKLLHDHVANISNEFGQWLLASQIVNRQVYDKV